MPSLARCSSHVSAPSATKPNETAWLATPHEHATEFRDDRRIIYEVPSAPYLVVTAIINPRMIVRLMAVFTFLVDVLEEIAAPAVFKETSGLSSDLSCFRHRMFMLIIMLIIMPITNTEVLELAVGPHWRGVDPSSQPLYRICLPPTPAIGRPLVSDVHVPASAPCPPCQVFSTTPGCSASAAPQPRNAMGPGGGPC